MGAGTPGEFKEAVRDQWTHAADAWRRWHPKFAQMTGAVTTALCEAAELRPGQAVLDLAGGTGEPGLTAAQEVAPGGRVTCTDFVPGMVATAEANAGDAGITNMAFQQVDAEDIPFDDASFDRVISRFGVMFFPNVQQALGEIRRVVKPDGRVAFAVWQTADKNAWFSDLNGLLMSKGLVQPPPPGMPSPFRFGALGSLPAELAAAGFKNVSETPHEARMEWPGPPEEYMDFIQATFPAWRKGLAEADAATREDTLAAMLDIVRSWWNGSSLQWSGFIYIVAATP